MANNLWSNTVPQLKDMLRQRGLKVGGRKAELIARLTYDTQPSEPIFQLQSFQPVFKPTPLIQTTVPNPSGQCIMPRIQPLRFHENSPTFTVTPPTISSPHVAPSPVVTAPVVTSPHVAPPPVVTPPVVTAPVVTAPVVPLPQLTSGPVLFAPSYNSAVSSPGRDISLEDGSPTIIPAVSPVIISANSPSDTSPILTYDSMGTGIRSKKYSELVYPHGLYYNPKEKNPSICDLVQQLNEVDPFEAERYLADTERLKSYANSLGVSMEGSAKELAERLEASNPCTWIRKIKEWAKLHPVKAKAMNAYVSDFGMNLLHKHRTLEPFNDDEKQFFTDLNQAILTSPRPDRPFVVYRGVRDEIEESLSEGETFKFKTPKSGAFYFEGIAMGYVNENGCCLLRINVPVGAIITYHPSEDQVIFPTGAIFRVIHCKVKRQIYAFENMDDYYVTDVDYIGVE